MPGFFRVQHDVEIAGRKYDAVAAGRMLILSPWQHDPDKRHVTRAECVAMNGMAEEISSVASTKICNIINKGKKDYQIYDDLDSYFRE